MHSMSAVALAVVLTAAPGSKHPPSFGWTHVRALSEAARTVMTKAAGTSATVRQLMDALEKTDVVAYVEVPRDSWHDAPLASLKFVGASARARFVLIRVDQWAAMTEAAPALAHELQHALEVALDPTVRDQAGLTRLYTRIGWQAGSGEFETTAAQAVERRARRDRAREEPVAGPRPR